MVTFGPLPLPPPWLVVLTSSRKSVAQMMLPPMRMRPNRRGITAPSVEEVMRKLSSRAPSMRCAGARDDTIQLSTTDPMVEPMKPPTAAPEKPRMAPPNAPPIAEPTAPRTRVAMDGVSIFGEEEREGDLARPCRSQGFLDDAQSFIGVDETVGGGQDADMLGDGARCHPEQNKCARPGLEGRDFRHHLARALGQHLAGAGLTPIPTVGRDREGLVADNLAPDTARQSKAVAADTTQAGLAEVLDAAKDQRAAGIIRLCMLTGSRVGEVRQARFEQFNLELGSWSKPAASTKQRKIHRIPISAEVGAIVRQRQLLVPKGTPWLFPGDVPGQPVKEIRRFWINVQKDAKLPDVRIHDLRHTFASLLVSGGASLEMIGKLLGHSQMQTTQRYAHLMDSPLRAGVDAVASMFRPRPKIVHDADKKSA